MNKTPNFPGFCLFHGIFFVSIVDFFGYIAFIAGERPGNVKM